jgi:hypothetical protein
MAEWTTKKTTPRGEPHHWYATSAHEWKVDDNLDRLIAKMKKSGYDFNVFRVEQPLDASYEIENYLPNVAPGELHFVGFWQRQS